MQTASNTLFGQNMPILKKILDEILLNMNQLMERPLEDAMKIFGGVKMAVCS
jgi:hypothetical protein